MSPRVHRRLLILQVLVLSLLVTLVGRLWYLQLLSGEDYSRAATDNRVREVVVPAVRGQIVDASGRSLVRNRTALVVSVSRTEMLKQPDNGEAVLRRLAEVLRLPYEEVAARVRLCAPGIPKPCWNGSPYQPVPVSDQVDTTMALTIMERRDDFPGVTAEPQAMRDYPAQDGVNAAHLVGYLSPVTEDEVLNQDEEGKQLKRTDQVGRAGLERSYDDDLRGTPGAQRLAVDHLGRVHGLVGETDPAPGNHLVTSLDARVQALAERSLLSGIEAARSDRDYAADSGALVVLDHQSGRVVAMASYPTYDPSVWVGGITEAEYVEITGEEANYPNQSRAYQGESAPGSTFKPVTTAAAAADGYRLDRTYPCTSSYQVGNRSFDNYESNAAGSVTLRRALEISCNTVFYRIAHEMWQRDGGNKPIANPEDHITEMAKAFGLGSPTGLDVPSESSGRIADRAWKQSYWEATKDESCRRADSGYPEVAEDDEERAAYLEQIARENCVDGYRLRAGDAVNTAIGQGDTTVTPLQMAVMYGAIANGGTLWSPRIGKAVVAPDGSLVRTIEPERRQLPVPAETLDYIREALLGVTTSGTAARPFAGFPLDEHPVGAKTGTGQVFGKQTTSWFASFDARYAIVMTVSQGGTGSGTSGPWVRAMYDGIYGLAGEEPLLPGGQPVEPLPQFRADGTVGESVVAG